jgi:branched-chain amino acid transport system permease protein
MALNLLTGGTGQISVGHGALFGIGAYVMAILVVKASVPPPLAVACAGTACFACGLGLGLPALRIRGLYLGLLTLSIAILLPALVKHWPGLTGGTGGLTLDPPVSPIASLTSAQWTYLVDLAVLLGAMVLVGNLARGRVGRAMDAIRHNELMAAAVGVRVGATKVVVFACSAGLAGVGGALYQLVLGTATPDTYTLSLSLSLLSGAVIGGIRSRWGAVLGAAFVVYVPDQTASLGDSAPQFAYAAALLIAVYVLPGGVAQVPSRVRARVTTRRVES